ncbi:uncharacterized protein LOC133179616 [Saccostrea echinata]|uniref:uncharacterized protein LOC133179616 n=1 Tax=Saccostrea echinata TaxID=191078 RepID=UPI002A817868|nr:uncharacterized protein LOC133179616 [Saccostrea echinata]
MVTELIARLAILGVLINIPASHQDFVSSCPCYGCRPSGTFSFSLSPPTNASVAWTSQFFIGPVPNALGCVGNANNIICQSNGPREVGYLSLDVATGNLMWRDGILRFPVLPVMDVYGDVIGSDGHSLVLYMDDGTLKPVIRMSDWVYPIFSLSITEDDIFMFVSKNGYVISYFPDGVCHASIPLPGELERVNGTFHPISTPVISGRRAYVLTQFIPEGSKEPGNLGMRRLYAIDVIPRMVDRLHISWVINFEMEIPKKTMKRGNVVFFDQEEEEKLSDTEKVPPRVMVNSDTDTVYVSLPAPSGTGSTKFWAIRDNQTSNIPEILFKTEYSLSSMATYEKGSDNQHTVNKRKDGLWEKFGPLRDNTLRSEREREKPSSVWAVHNNKEIILEISPFSGSIIKSINISQVLKSKAMVTSDIMVTRSNVNDADHLVFTATLVNGPSVAFSDLCKSLGISKSENKNYVIQMEEDVLSWAIPTAKDLPGIGQIAGIKTHDDSNDLRDMYVVFAGDNESSVVFGVH